MASPPFDFEKIGDFASGSRLDSWKEIAAYLRKSEKTVRRWEMDRGLPIHRAPGAGRTAVYAFTSELDHWLKSGRAEDPEASQPDILSPNYAADPALPSTTAPQPSPRPNPRLHWRPIAAVLLAATALGVALIAARHSSRPAPSLPTRAATPLPDAEVARAHELYLKGRYEWNQRTPDSLNRALDDFTQAVVHNPNDARSYVGLADTYNLLHIYSTLPLTDSYPRAIAAARRAIQLDSSLAEAHRALAFAEFYGAGNWLESEKEFRRAIQLDPNDPITRRWYGNAFALPGRYEESMAQFDKAQELDPGSHSTLSDKGIILYNLGRTDEAISLLKQVEQTDPSFYSPHVYLMDIAQERHDDRTFLEEGEKASAIRNDAVLRDIIKSARDGYASAGDAGLLRNLYAKQEQYYAAGKLSGGPLALTCVELGKRQEALRLLEVAYDRHEADALWSLGDPLLRSMKDEPQYKDLVRKINFPGVNIATADPSSSALHLPPNARAASSPQ